ncbi:MAG TPA: LysR family transcriptional regulator [Pilimelia sp.]|nr:LysR family transcriptional regulator [Pilimelia sp.]
MHVEVRHARVVAAVAREGSISGGAARLGLPQPSVTAQLRRIERAMGGDLFVRSHAGVVPTPLGERLIPLFVDLARRADVVVAEAAVRDTEVLRIGNTEWTPAPLRDALQASLPRVEMQTETTESAAALTAVRRGVLSAALVFGTGDELLDAADRQGLLHEVIFREPVWLAVPHGHPLAASDIVGLRQLRAVRWVRLAKEHWFAGAEKQLFARFGDTPPEVVHHAGGHAEAMSWVRDAGVAAWANPTGATAEVDLIPVRTSVQVRLLLVWRLGAISRATATALVESVRLYYTDYARTRPRYWTWMAANRAEFTELARYLPHPR